MYKLADCVAQIRNGYKAKMNFIITCKNKECIRACSILYEMGFITGYTILDHSMIVYLKYINNRSVVRKISIISKPSGRIYVKKAHLLAKQKFTTFNYGLSFLILSTSRDRMFLSDVECIMKRCGGEVKLLVG